ncbi:ferritin [Actomonas aquatica]|uniref:Ferritin n=1 Tax=Actomonas aquatica TaxID=2866162 RepID=A0ABZ1C7G9_9BACT|nr:ferritin [Opitutus sp. WL0086]WRQ87347.1 ferritin [Opitutus sp. WL0086]
MAISPTLQAAFETQGNREFATAKAYFAMACWCEARNWSGFAKLFTVQTSEEQEHAHQFFHFLVDRDVSPEVGSVPAPTSKFSDLIAVAKAAFDLERANTAAIHALYELALAEKDYAAQAFLHPFLLEQVEEEAWTDKLLDKTRQANCAGGLFNLDRHVVREVLGDQAK